MDDLDHVEGNSWFALLEEELAKNGIVTYYTF